jgi:poly(3-hydroxybutyrate) depolymerase
MTTRPKWLHCLTLLACGTLPLTVCCQKNCVSPKNVCVASADVESRGGDNEHRSVLAAGKSGIIDDFETEPDRIALNEGRDGYWYSYDDSTGGKLEREERRDGTGVLYVASSGFTNWGAGVGFTLNPETSRTKVYPYDASAYSGIRLRARGRGRVRLLATSVASTPKSEGGSCTRSGDSCYDRPGVWVDLTGDWQTMSYPFCALVSEGWGSEPLGLSPADIVGFQFQFESSKDVELWLDDLEFFTLKPGETKSGCGPKCPMDAVPRGSKIEPSFSTLTLTEELTVHTFQQPTKSCGALTRRYLSYVPKRLSPRASVPVLIVLHGTGANAESMQHDMTHGRFDELAARDGFIVVYGNAAPGAYTDPFRGFPNTGVWNLGLYTDGEVDDVAYLLAVLDDLAVRGVTSGSNPVYLTGLSNGGGMVLEAAKRAPERFRGIAALMPYDGAEPTPVPELQNKGLDRVLFMYSVNDPGLPIGHHEVLKTLPPKWAAALGIPPTVVDNPKRTELPDRVREGDGYSGTSKTARATQGSQATRYDMVGKETDAQICLVVLDHAGHFWPNPVGDKVSWMTDRWGFRNQDFDAAELVWDFFSSSSTK